MITVTIPGGETLKLEYLVLDYNGTLALDGFLIPGVADLLTKLSENLKIHVITADTFCLAAQGLEGLPVELKVLSPKEQQDQAIEKLVYVNLLGADNVFAIGNGLNDNLMVSASALGIAIIGPEGASKTTIMGADIICPDIKTALSLLLNPLRIVATLRN
jgi:soluble P-type ATPase